MLCLQPQWCHLAALTRVCCIVTRVAANLDILGHIPCVALVQVWVVGSRRDDLVVIELIVRRGTSPVCVRRRVG